MSSVVIAGDTSGTVTLQAPAVAGTTTISLPATTGTMALTSDISPSFAAGTRLGFQQTAAPTGWTKDTTAGLNDSVMRIVTGAASSGGSTAFSTWAAVTATGAYTLATADIPSHTHSYTAPSSASAPSGSVTSSFITTTAGTTGAQGGGGAHSHSLSQNIKYYDFIIASKN